MSTTIEQVAGLTAAERPVEVVERKGLGHPDTICDMLSEQLSIALSKYYVREFGLILHHNVDKALIVGGQSEPKFGGGRIIEPMRIFLSGRATNEVHGRKIPVMDIAYDTARRWFRENMRAVDFTNGVKLESFLRPGSSDLVDLFIRQRGRGVFLANDTSCGVGIAPRTPLETIVLGIERTLNSAEIKTALPMTGEDIKVMGVREGSNVSLTVSCAFIDAHLSGIADYGDALERVRALALETAQAAWTEPLEVQLNAADDIAAGSIFLTVSGTSAEAGDDGETGRGNRGNGLITPCRPMTMEAMAGKNPVTHVGKLYSVAAGRIADTLVSSVPGVREAQCYLVSRIGERIEKPQLSHVRITGESFSSAMRDSIDDIVASEVSAIPELWHSILGESEQP